MMDNAEIGRRIKAARQQREMTLKAVEAASGVSATHVSEIERGTAAPTVGALMRIAHALGRRPAYFLEENEIGDASLVTRSDRVRESAGSGATIERLTAGIPGGRVQVLRVMLAPGGGHRDVRHDHEGVEFILVLNGRVRVDAGGEEHELGAGDAIHYEARVPHAYRNASRDEAATLLWVASRRDVK